MQLLISFTVRQAMYTETRNCGRIIWDDREMVSKIWNRVGNMVPEILNLDKDPHITGYGPVKRKEVWKFTRLNERMRFLKYQGGEYFRREYWHTFCALRALLLMACSAL